MALVTLVVKKSLVILRVRGLISEKPIILLEPTILCKVFHNSLREKIIYKKLDLTMFSDLLLTEVIIVIWTLELTHSHFIWMIGKNLRRSQSTYF